MSRITQKVLGPIHELTEKEWVLQFFSRNNVVILQATAGNISTFASGSGTHIGSIEVSTNGTTYTPISFPFTPMNGVWYYFKRSSTITTGNYTLIE